MLRVLKLQDKQKDDLHPCVVGCASAPHGLSKIKTGNQSQQNWQPLIIKGVLASVDWSFEVIRMQHPLVTANARKWLAPNLLCCLV
jgi:hypothetical protein